MYKVDFHTHSVASYDGGISEAGYRALLDRGIIDCVAITDHNEISFALALQAKLGDRIIVGEEIMTKAGEVIGLYLNRLVEKGMALEDTIAAIKAQNGLVYVPHPFETFRKGLNKIDLESIADKIDMLEVFNGRALVQNRSGDADLLCDSRFLKAASSSDAHCFYGVGRSYTLLSEIPKRNTALSLLASAEYSKKLAVWWTLLCPRVNTIRKAVGV